MAAATIRRRVAPASERRVTTTFTGRVVQLGGVYNPWTVGYAGGRQWYNPWTGRSGGSGSFYNSWTGRAGVGVYRRRW